MESQEYDLERVLYDRPDSVHGLPDGPRHRLAAIYTGISNLPDTATDEHTWMSAFCRWCRQCHRKCPGQAIYDEPISR